MPTIGKVSSVERGGDGCESSLLEADMAEQGRKARASEARLEEVGAVSASDNGRGTSSALKGLMPLQCGVSGRQVVFRGRLVSPYNPKKSLSLTIDSIAKVRG